MSIIIWKRPLLCLKNYNFYCYLGVRKCLSISTKLDSKKPYRIKNKFAFEGDLKKVSSENLISEITSSDFFSKENDCDKENDSKFLQHGIISADLLSQGQHQSQRKNILSQKTRSKKPSLAYQGEILFGVHPVYLALLQKKRTFYHLYTRDDIDSSPEDISRKGEIIKFARILNIPISFIDSRGLRILAPGAVHQGICLDAGFLPLPLWNEDYCNMHTSERRPIWLVLDEILDPMNVGAIIRSAHYFGINMLFTVRGNSCKLSPTVSKASSGVLEVMNIYQIGNLEEFIKKRKESDWSIVSTSAYSSSKSGMIKSLVSADQFSTARPTILILGNEGKGVSENILKLCDLLISIKPGQVLPKGIDSLNVSVAAGVLLYVLSHSKNER